MFSNFLISSNLIEEIFRIEIIETIYNKNPDIWLILK